MNGTSRGITQRALVGTAAVIVGLGSVSVGLANSASAKPGGNGGGQGTGNNGTVKVVDPASNTEPPNNEPHLPCTFEVEWRGYEAPQSGSDLVSSVKFTVWNPDKNQGTEFFPGGGQEMTDEVELEEDPSVSGANDLDATELYTLTFDQDPKNANQGYHVRIDIKVDDDKKGNADKKSKVFWIEDCREQPTTPTSNPTTPTSEPVTCPNGSALPTEDIDLDGDIDSDDCDEFLGSESSRPGDGDGDAEGDGDGDAPGDAEVLGIEAEAPAAAPTAVDAGSSAEETGTNSSLWLFAGAALALAGAVLGFTPARARGKRAR